MDRRGAPRFALVASLLAVATGSASGQQYVWSVPSADVLERDGLLFEGYAYWGLQGPDSWYGGPRATFGLGNHIEAGVNLSASLTPVRNARLELALKWQPWRSANGKWVLTGGGIAYVPLHELDYVVGGFGWGHVTRTLGAGASVSAGAFAYSKGVVAAGTVRTGVALAWEQPLGGPWTFAADWTSGPEGYATAGFFYEVNPKLYASSAYVFGNQGVRAGNHFLLAALSWYPR